MWQYTPHAYLRSWRNTPHSRFRETVTYTPTPGLQHTEVNLSCGRAGIYFQLVPSKNRFFFTRNCQEGRGSAFRPDGLSFCTAGSSPNHQLCAFPLERACWSRIASHKPQNSFFPQNDSADVVQTSPRNVSVLSMERLWFEGTGVSHKWVLDWKSASYSVPCREKSWEWGAAQLHPWGSFFFFFLAASFLEQF